MNWNQQVEDAMREAKNLARQKCYRVVNSGHVLAALMVKDNGIVSRTLLAADLSVERVVIWGAIYGETCDQVFSPCHENQDLPWSQHAVLITEGALMEATRYQHHCVGVEHLLIAITHMAENSLKYPGFSAGQILNHFRISPKKIREEILTEMASDDPFVRQEEAMAATA